MNKIWAQLISLILLALLGVSALAGESQAPKKADAKQSALATQEKNRQSQRVEKGNKSASAGNRKSSVNTVKTPKEPVENDAGKLSPPDDEKATVASVPAHEHPKITEQLAATVKIDDPINYLNDTKVLVTLAALMLLALGLHIAQVFMQVHTREKVTGMQSTIQRLSISNPKPEPAPGKSAAAGNLAEQLNRQREEHQQISAQLEEVKNGLAESGKQMAETLVALTATVHWIGQSQIDQIVTQIGNRTSEADHAQMIRVLERYRDVFRLNASHVSPLSEAMRSFVERARARPNLPAEITGKAEALYQDIRQFDSRHADLNKRLDSLQRGSLADRLSLLKSQHGQLAQQINAGTISISDYVRAYRNSFDSHFPEDAEASPVELTSVECEAELKRNLTSLSDYLMRWFDELFQLQSQVSAAQASDSQIDAHTVVELTQIQVIARDVLGKFDIQPEEIQIGRTFYDRRLHDAELIAQSVQFPANTVIGVNQCGFRRVSTGEVLRRPRVIVAGVGAV